MKPLYLNILAFSILSFSVASGQEIASANKSTTETGNKTAAANVLPGETEKMVAYDFDVYDIVPGEMKKVTTELAGTHFLGDQIAKKIYILEDLYSYTEPISPGNSATKTLYRKPVIYFSVKKIEKYLKKSLKKGEITMEDATARFNRVLDIAINIKNKNTDKLEEALNSANDASDLLLIYSRVRLSTN
jgi:hypothetical protein